MNVDDPGLLARLRAMNAADPEPTVDDLRRRIEIMHGVIVGMDAELVRLRALLSEADGVARANQLVDPSQWSRILEIVRRPPPLMEAHEAVKRGLLEHRKRAEELRAAGLSAAGIAVKVGAEEGRRYTERTVRRWLTRTRDT